MTKPNDRQTELVDRFGGPAWTPAASTPASLDAAARVHRSGRAATVRLSVLRYLCAVPSTDYELIQALQAPENTIRPRRRDLVKSGLVVATDETRLTGNGSKATVWTVTERGLAVARGEVEAAKEDACG